MNNMHVLKCIVLLLFFLLPVFSLEAQGRIAEENPASYIGLTLIELISRLGVPGSVYPARGLEEWQDDVVFVYEMGDFYILKDRVWQVGLRTFRGIKTGDTRALVSLILGSDFQSRNDSIFYSLDGGSWPMMLRLDIDKDDKVKVIFIYRTDL